MKKKNRKISPVAGNKCMFLLWKEELETLFEIINNLSIFDVEIAFASSQLG